MIACRVQCVLQMGVGSKIAILGIPLNTPKVEKYDYDVATNVNYGVASFSSWCESMCSRRTCITIITWPRWLPPPFENEHFEQTWTGLPTPLCLPQEQAHGLPHTWLVEIVWFTPTMTWWIICCKVHQNFKLGRSPVWTHMQPNAT